MKIWLLMLFLLVPVWSVAQAPAEVESSPVTKKTTFEWGGLYGGINRTASITQSPRADKWKTYNVSLLAVIKVNIKGHRFTVQNQAIKPFDRRTWLWRVGVSKRIKIGRF